MHIKFTTENLGKNVKMFESILKYLNIKFTY